MSKFLINLTISTAALTACSEGGPSYVPPACDEVRREFYDCIKGAICDSRNALSLDSGVVEEMAETNEPDNGLSCEPLPNIDHSKVEKNCRERAILYRRCTENYLSPNSNDMSAPDANDMSGDMSAPDANHMAVDMSNDMALGQ